MKSHRRTRPAWVPFHYKNAQKNSMIPEAEGRRTPPFTPAPQTANIERNKTRSTLL